MEYLERPWTITVKLLWWQKQGLQQTATGYGRKLTTEYMLTVPGERPRRVYAVCFSNASSHYILRKGKEQWLRDADLGEERDKARGGKQ